MNIFDYDKVWDLKPSLRSSWDVETESKAKHCYSTKTANCFVPSFKYWLIRRTGKITASRVHPLDLQKNCKGLWKTLCDCSRQRTVFALIFIKMDVGDIGWKRWYVFWLMVLWHKNDGDRFPVVGSGIAIQELVCGHHYFGRSHSPYLSNVRKAICTRFTRCFRAVRKSKCFPCWMVPIIWNRGINMNVKEGARSVRQQKQSFVHQVRYEARSVRNLDRRAVLGPHKILLLLFRMKLPSKHTISAFHYRFRRIRIVPYIFMFLVREFL